MAGDITVNGVNPWRIAAWSGAGLILLMPLIAMQFTEEVRWTGPDFVFAGVLIGGVGLAFELAVRGTRNVAYRAAAVVALAAAFLTLWVNGAVGMIGSEDNPYNLLLLGVIALALVGSAAARFRAGGTARAMIVAAVAQAGFGVAGLAVDMRGGILSTAFAGLWLLSAALFGKVEKRTII